MGLRGSWTYQGDFGPVDIELRVGRVGRVDAATADETHAVLRRLVYAFVHRNAEARRIVLGIYARLHGASAGFAAGASFDFDAGSLRARAVGDELLRAGATGTIVARRRALRSVIVPLPDAGEAVLGPDPAGDAAPDSKSWVGVVLVDQDGTPVPSRPYRIVAPGGSTFDGTLDSNGSAIVKDLDPGSCQIWCPNVAPHPETTYVVQPGEHLSGIAQTFGFDDYTVVWNDPNNADLQTQRPDPHVLQPGDTLYVPALQATPAANKPTGAKHTFTLQRSPLKLRLKLLDLAVKPVASASVTVGASALTTDGTGLVEAPVDKGASDVAVQTPGGNLDFGVATLNSTDDATDVGWKARLFNLGFLWDPTVDEGDDEMLIAIQDFQAQYSLQVSGQLDDDTKAQLLQVYGC